MRDRALLLFGFGSGGRRRSEVAAARVEELVPLAGGYFFRLRRSKTDQGVAPRSSMRPPRLAGDDPRKFGRHSLRLGFVTTGGQGVSLGDAMALSGHRGAAVALRHHQGGAALDNPASKLAD